MAQETLQSIDGSLSGLNTDIAYLEQRHVDLLQHKIKLLEADIHELQVRRCASQHGAKFSSDLLLDTGSVQGQPKKQDNTERDTELQSPRTDTLGKNAKPELQSRVRNSIRKQTEDGEFKTDFGSLTEQEEKQDPTPMHKDEYAIHWQKTLNAEDTTNDLLIESQALRKALKAVIKDYGEISFDTSEVRIEEPYECIYHHRRDLEEYAKKADVITKSDILLLLDELDKKQETTKKDIETLTTQGMTRFDLLWTLYYPGCQVYSSRLFEEQPQVLIVKSSRYRSGPSGKYFGLELFYIDYVVDTTKRFTRLGFFGMIKQFRGSKAIRTLEYYPLKYSEREQNLMKHLIKRGRKFEELCTMPRQQRLFKYGGAVLDEGPNARLPDASDDEEDDSTRRGFIEKGQKSRTMLPKGSHVMVDPEAYRTFGGKDLGLKRSFYFQLRMCSCRFCKECERKYDGYGPEVQDPKKKKLDEDQLLLCPPNIAGFDLKRKAWIQMLVDNVDDIDQESKAKAFNNLEMEDQTKRLLKTLVLQHKNSNRLPDLVPGKGNGLIILLHGAPGTGKTLTAESLAMLAKKPLFSISMSDVGTTPATVEANLEKIFDLTVHWEAVLLFDEADVFLESRDLRDLKRNGLVAVLLRVLEYYDGILFLTTNRAKTFDEGIRSRVHVAVQFKELDDKDREKLWSSWLDRLDKDTADVAGIKEFVEELARDQLNGRQIRNVITLAQVLATETSSNEKMQYNHVRRIMRATRDFERYMQQSEAVAKDRQLR